MSGPARSVRVSGRRGYDPSQTLDRLSRSAATTDENG
jgi:hypothetical protein